MLDIDVALELTAEGIFFEFEDEEAKAKIVGWREPPTEYADSRLRVEAYVIDGMLSDIWLVEEGESEVKVARTGHSKAARMLIERFKEKLQ